jgi:hypothetical protein
MGKQYSKQDFQDAIDNHKHKALNHRDAAHDTYKMQDQYIIAEYDPELHGKMVAVMDALKEFHRLVLIKTDRKK